MASRTIEIKATRKRWTESEVKEFVAIYGSRSAPQIARHFGRTTSSVYLLAYRLGLMKPRKTVSRKVIEKALLQLNPKGLGDTEIACFLAKKHGCQVNRHRVGKIRQQLGLEIQACSERNRSKVAAKTREQLGIAGVKSLAELRLERWNKWKRDLGWPEHLTIRAVQAAEIFWQMRGLPITRLQLCELMGISSKKRTAPLSNHPSGTVLGELAAEGIIVRIPKGLPTGQGRGRSKDVYMLKEGIKKNGQSDEIERSQEVRSNERGFDAVASPAQGGMHQQHKPGRHGQHRSKAARASQGR